MPGDVVTVTGVVKTLSAEALSGRRAARDGRHQSLYLLYLQANGVQNRRQEERVGASCFVTEGGPGLCRRLWVWLTMGLILSLISSLSLDHELSRRRTRCWRTTTPRWRPRDTSASSTSRAFAPSPRSGMYVCGS